MKTIIAATDFTPSSHNACLYAAMLSKKLDCKLVIFNLFDIPAIHTNSGLFFISYQAIREGHSEKLEKEISEIKSEFPKLSVSSLLTTGSFKLEIQGFINSHQVEAVVIGLAAKTRLSKFIYGSHSTDIAGKINAPVIIVPEKFKKHSLKSVLLGVDNTEKLNKTALKKFETIMKESKSSLHLLHVRTEEEVFFEPMKEFKLNDKSHKINSFFAKNTADGLNKCAQKYDADLITVISRSHSPLYELFAETNTKKIAFVSKVPVMAIHE